MKGIRSRVFEREGDTSTAIEGAGFRLQVAGCNRLVDSDIDPRAYEMSWPTGRFRGATDVTSVRANRVAGIVYGSG